MKGRTRKIAVAFMLALSMTITALPVQLLSGLTGKSGVVNADEGIQYTEIGANSQNTDSSDFLPIHQRSNYGFTEQIYTADELNGVTTISAMAFKINKAGNLQATVDIYFLNTEKSSFADSKDGVPLDEATLVYSGNLNTKKTGWNYLNLNQSFTRETDKNLMVIVDNISGSWSYNIAEFDVYQSDNSNCSLYVYRLDDAYDINRMHSFKNKLRLFSSSIPYYNLAFNDNRGGTFTELTLAFTTINVISPQLAGYAFHGWNTDREGNGTSYSRGDEIILTGDTTLYAQWVKTNTITYMANDGSENSSTQDYDPTEEVRLAGKIFTRDGCFVKGWNTDSEGNGTHYDVSASIRLTGDTTLYAEWGNLNTITYMANDGSENSSTQDYDPTEDVRLAGDIFSRDGYFFKGWNTDPEGNGTHYDVSASIRLAEDTTLYAEWVKTNTITYMANDGSENSSTQDYDPNEDVRLAGEIFSCDGCFFKGWNTQADGQGDAYASSETISISGDLVLYAQWETIRYVVYHSNDGSDQSYTQVLNQNENTIYYNPFFRAHYLFTGWNTKADGTGVFYHPGQTIEDQQDLVLFAQWERTVYYDFSTSPEDSGWVFIDADEDGHSWCYGIEEYDYEESFKSHSGETDTDGSVMVSASYDDVTDEALTPDNWAVSPAGLVDPDSEMKVSLWAVAEDSGWYEEHFAIYAAKASDVDLTKEIDLDQWTQISEEYEATGEWCEYTGDLSSFSGQNVYVAIRHYDTEDMYYLNIDDVSLPFIEYDESISEHLAGHSVSLDGDIAVNFYMELDQSILESSTAEMIFKVPNGDKTNTQTVKVSEVKDHPVEIDGKTYYIFKCKVAPKDMTGEITAQIRDENRVGKTYTYSVKEYASYILSAEAGTYEDKTIRLVKALLNYGAAAQMYFGVDTQNLANSEISNEEKNLSGITAEIINKPYDPSETVLPNGVTFEYVTLSLKSETTLSLYFKSEAKLSFSCAGMKVERSTTSDGYQVARIRNINASDLGKDFEITITAGDESGTVTYSPMTYCYNVLDRGSDKPALIDICRSLYLFKQAVASYNS